MLGQARSTQKHERAAPDDEERLTENIVDLTAKYGRYGYRRVTALLHSDGWRVNHKWVERIWRSEGLKVPKKQPKRDRLWFNRKLRDELLNGEIFYTLREARVLIERWREEYNRVRPHWSLGYRSPAPQATLLGRPPLRSGRPSSE